MIATELQEIKEYWASKYPYVDIRLGRNTNNSKYYGHMVHSDSNLHFEADTVGELISLGESFLRTMKLV